MRKVILSILLAGAAATPAIAQDRGDDGQDGRQHAREAREARQERHEQAREQRSEAPHDFGRGRQQEQQAQPQAPPPPPQQVEARRQQWQGGNSGGAQQGEAQQQRWQRRGGFDGRGNVQADVAPQQEQQRRDGSRWSGDRSGWTGNRDAQTGTWSRGDLRQGDRATPNVMRDRNGTIVNQSQQTQNRRWSHSGTWNRDWRNDRRYDWRRYRDSHRSIFHIGIYYDPFGYNYRRFDIGYRLQPYYYQQQYWIDPGMYQLPYPPPGTMWVRYWDDALLVDTYTGEVVDVIRNFFW
jgi:Ni/Co efflux regulator RcnB